MNETPSQQPGLPLRSGKPTPGGFLPRVRGAFAHGLAILLPTLLTIIIILWAYSLLDKYANVWLQYLLAWTTGWGIEKTRQFWAENNWGWLGILVNLVVVFLVGLAARNFLGRSAWRIVEGILLRIPLISQVYPYVKQVTDFVLQERPLEFSSVAMVEYPRRGCWSIGFITNKGFPQVRDRLGRDVVTLFIPSSPTPVTGYTIQVPRDDVIELDLTVDESLRYVISGGVINPLLLGTGAARPVEQAPPEARGPGPSAVEADDPGGGPPAGG